MQHRFRAAAACGVRRLIAVALATVVAGAASPGPANAESPDGVAGDRQVALNLAWMFHAETQRRQGVGSWSFFQSHFVVTAARSRCKVSRALPSFLQLR